MASSNEDRFVFETEWFDQQAALVRKYLLTYYPKDNTIDMVSATDTLPALVRREEQAYVPETDGLP